MHSVGRHAAPASFYCTPSHLLRSPLSVSAPMKLPRWRESVYTWKFRPANATLSCSTLWGATMTRSILSHSPPVLQCHYVGGSQEIRKVRFLNFRIDEVKDEHCNCKRHTYASEDSTSRMRQHPQWEDGAGLSLGVKQKYLKIEQTVQRKKTNLAIKVHSVECLHAENSV